MLTSVLVWLLACGGPLPNRIEGGIDDDGDGFASVESGGRDCDDADPGVNPLTPELCDGVDQNCDGIIDDRVAVLVYTDNDQDGVGGGEPELQCDPAADALVVGGDCDDDNDAVYPGATELCDGIDNDCDGLAEQAPPSWWPDTDGDGFGAGLPIEDCTQPEGYVDNDTDCDDGLGDVNPDAPERCNGIDDDCNGIIDTDAGQAQSWWPDVDEDGFGDASAASSSGCEAPEGSVGNKEDCDDDDADVNPDADEVCNSIDDDCDGTTDVGASDSVNWYTDADSDGFGDEGSTATRSCSQPSGKVSNDGDCDDDDIDVNPDAQEVCNGYDDNCDDGIDDGDDAPVWYPDEDGDSWGDPFGAVKQCTSPQGYVSNGADCDDVHGNANPAGTEACDGIDNDCKNGIDDNTCGTVTNENCEPHAFGGHNYLFCDRERGATYYAAACASFSGYYPVWPQSADENTFLKNTANSISDQYWWIGIDDVFSEGNFQYAGTNTAIGYSNWKSNEPNGGIGENCVEMRTNGQWNDQSCFSQRRYICEHD